MLDFLGDLKRTHYAGELRATHADQRVVLMGWVHRRRDLGNLIFIDLRDRSGIAQIVFNKEEQAAAHSKAEQLRSEFVVAVEGRVVRRARPNPDLPTGEVEVIAAALHVLNTATTPVFPIEEQINATEETRLRYRYLDLRRPKPHANLVLRHAVILEIRKALDELGFYEVETPMLTRSTPEGARDYLVPSRVHPGQFYALPQSPQIFKQILMIAGFDRYFQIARCFRDEDLRADRQPDFTQLDLEMSFVRPDDVFDVIERVMARAMRVIGVAAQMPFRRMLYRDAIRRYGSDKPDLRFGLELHDVTQFFAPARPTLQLETDVNVYALVVEGAAEKFSRKQVDELTERAKSLGAKGLYTAKVSAAGVQSGLEKILGADALKQMAAGVGAKPGDFILATAAKQPGKGSDASALIAGQLRLHLAEKLGLVQRDKWEFVWLTGFPLFEWSDAENAWVPAQHPFTGVFEEDLDKLEDVARRGEIRSKGYDLVLNGVELGSGSVRIHRADVQARVFRAMGLTDEQARQRFGFFLDALSYGTPPHGGIALGLDRVVMLMAGETSLREVIAFPKTAKAQDLMADAPSAVDAPQEEELELMGAFHDLPSRTWAIAILGDDLLRLIYRELLSRKYEPDTAYKGAMSLIVGKAYDDSRAVLRLAKAGYGSQAAGLCRSIVEAAINSRYIQKDPETRGGRFLDSIEEENQSLAKKAKPHPMPEDVREALAEAERIQTKSGWPRKVADRAYNVEEPNYAYDIVFFMLSQILHSNVSSLSSKLSERSPGEFAVHIGRGSENVEKALVTMLDFMAQVAVVAYEAFGIDDSNFKALDERFKSVWGPTSASSD